jgi:hypothetical protein
VAGALGKEHGSHPQQSVAGSGTPRRPAATRSWRDHPVLGGDQVLTLRSVNGRPRNACLTERHPQVALVTRLGGTTSCRSAPATAFSSTLTTSSKTRRPFREPRMVAADNAQDVG